MTETTQRDRSNISKRIETAKGLGLHPMCRGFKDFRDLEEGEHYEVLAYTDRADVFVPTVVKWANGETDDLTDRETSVENALESLRGSSR